MRIDQLPVASAIGNTDTLPFNNNGLSKQISVGNLTNSIRDNVYGAPLTASTSSAMTDTSRVYVYTGTTGGGFTNGHWYYYSGSAWTDGGVYNSSAVQTDTTLTLAGVPADAKATGELKAVIDDKLASFDVAIETFYPHSGGVGNIVTVEGTVDAPPAELIIYGKSAQNGTPTPSAPVNIVTAGSGGTLAMVSAGKNLLKYVAALSDVGDSMTSLGLTVKHLADGGLSIVGTTSNSGNLIISALNNSNPLQIPDGRYTLTQVSSGLPSSSNVYMWLKSGQTKFAPSTFDFVRNEVNATANIGITFRAGVEVNCTVYPMLRPTEIADAAFAPYNGISAAIPTPNGLPGIPVASGGNYTETDGQQWICDTIDLEAGTWTKRCGVVTLDGSENWQKGISFYLDGNDFYAVFPGTYANAPGLCNMFIVVTDGGSNNGTARFAGNGHQFLCYTSVASTVSEWKAVLNNTHMTIVYPLAAPEVVQLTTAQLTALRSLRGRKGLTNLYSADPVEPEFRAEMYIDIPTYIQWLLHQMDRGFNVAAVNNGLEFTSIE